MTTLLEITEGWTQRLGPFTLRVDGEPFDLNGYTVELLLRPKSRPSADPAVFSETAGNLSYGVVASGQVYFTPDATDLLAIDSPYTLHWKVTDGDDKVVFFPNGTPDEIAVVWP